MNPLRLAMRVLLVRHWRDTPFQLCFLPVNGSESAQHLELKRSALLWAQEQSYPIAATEVSVPQFRSRYDVAAFRPRKTSKRTNQDTPLGISVIFECKQARADFLKDAAELAPTSERLERLHTIKALQEEALKVWCPSLRNGDSLFAEYETYRFNDARYSEYESVLAEIASLATKLHSKTKFSKLTRWQAANLRYIVTTPGVARLHELPFGWGLLELVNGTLVQRVQPVWQDVSDDNLLLFLQRIAIAGTRAHHRAIGIQPQSKAPTEETNFSCSPEGSPESSRG